MGAAACGEDALRSGQGRGQEPAGPTTTLQECQAWEPGAGVACLSDHLPPAPTSLPPFLPLPWGVFRVLLAWTGVGWTWAVTTGDGCPFRDEEALRWGPRGLEKRDEGGQKARTSR